MRCPFCGAALLGDVNPDPIRHLDDAGEVIAYQCPLCDWAWPNRSCLGSPLAEGQNWCTEQNLVASGVLP